MPPTTTTVEPTTSEVVVPPWADRAVKGMVVLLELKDGQVLRCNKIEADKDTREYTCIMGDKDIKVGFDEERKPDKSPYIPSRPGEGG